MEEQAVAVILNSVEPSRFKKPFPPRSEGTQWEQSISARATKRLPLTFILVFRGYLFYFNRYLEPWYFMIDLVKIMRRAFSFCAPTLWNALLFL